MDNGRVFVIAGEASGDLHAGSMVRELSRRRPGLQFSGIGGYSLSDAGVSILHHSDQLSFMGFAEVVRHLPYLFRVMGDVRSYLATYQPKLVILVDYPAFNLRVARAARSLGCRVLYYIAPQVWAWHEERIVTLAQETDALACVLPFEKEFFDRKSLEYDVELNARFVGHPLIDIARPQVDPDSLRSELLLPEQSSIVALMPGSRRQEVVRLLPRMAEAVVHLRKSNPELIPVLCAVPGIDDTTYRRILAATALKVAPALPDGSRYRSTDGLHLVRGRTYDVLSAARGGLVASGTATLEAALLETPMVIAYQMNFLSWKIGQARVKVPHVGLVNLVAGQRLVPEVLQGDVTGRILADQLSPMLEEGTVRMKILEGFEGVRQRLGEPGAAGRVAEMAVELIDRE